MRYLYGGMIGLVVLAFVASLISALTRPMRSDEKDGEGPVDPPGGPQWP